MGLTVERCDDAGVVLERAGAYLRREPIRHNLLLTLLTARATSGEPGRYWVVAEGDGSVAGVAFQSPLGFVVALSAMSAEAAVAAAEAIATDDDGIDVPGANGEVTPSAAFVGRWTELRSTGAVVSAGMRLYEAPAVLPPDDVPGRLRPAELRDRELLLPWMQGFKDATGESGDAATGVDSRLGDGLLYVWETDDGEVSMAAITAPVEGVVRVQCVYTPEDLRGHGYAAACVAALTQQELDRGHRVCLYTDLGNATSNGVYRRIGYVAVAEALRYRFTH